MVRREKIIIVLIIVILILGIGSDTVFSNFIPEILVLSSYNLSDFGMMIYQIQATIATLGIALIAILSGTSNDTLYGISIARYILQIRPCLLKHKNVITIIIGFVLANYFFISFQMFNSIIAALSITAVLILSMTYEVFTVFEGRERLKIEIGDYVISNLRKIDVLDIVFKDTQIAIDREEFLRFKEDMNLVLKLFQNSKDLIVADSILKERWESNLVEIFADAFMKTRGINIQIVYKYFEDFYKTIFNEFKKPDEIVLWDGVSIEFYKALRAYNVESIEDLSIFDSIRWIVYKCQQYKIENEKILRNNHSIEYLYIRIYYEILSNDFKVTKLNKSEIGRKLKFYYEEIENDMRFAENHNIIPVLMKEFMQYTKLLIDNQEKKILDQTFVRQINDSIDYFLPDEFKEYHFTIIIYLYYLAKKEERIEEAQKVFANELMDNLSAGISNYLLNISFQEPLNQRLIDTVRRNLEWWVYKPDNDDVIDLVMDSIIDSFLLYYAVYSYKNIETLKTAIKAIVGTNEFRFVSDYIGERKESNKDNYKEFVITFYNPEIGDDEIEADLNRLENVLFEIYRVSLNESGDKNALDTSEVLELQKEIGEAVLERINPNFKAFEFFEDDKKYGKEIIEFSLYADSRSIGVIKDFICNETLNRFVDNVINLFIDNKQLALHEVNNKDKQALNELFNLIIHYKIDVNTLIGYRDWFFGYDKELDFKELEARSFKIKSLKRSNVLVCLDSKKVMLTLNRCDINIMDVDFESYKLKLDKDENGNFLYKITDDIFIPYKEEELQRLIKNTLKIIQIKIDYMYSFKGDTFGVGLSRILCF